MENTLKNGAKLLNFLYLCKRTRKKAMEVRIDSSWKEILGDEFDKEYFVRLTEFVRAEYGRRPVYTPAAKKFGALD